ncbi:CDP-diacylglycerol--serine O-phosphatidyltransferase [Vibrio cincinnatiensis]|uniref:CDP-diacylglycerol--serine O-phosphatidyltransferase n=1 Tax=Vibrio cincinnatiensis TaxID=675 RepID=UPI001EDE55AB|nr:CDP-diacylglycerol--serine O-phosphatidyltransferase [Vibrio cincinnatiensis]MCG3734494.1 CDP-diacylglycerol--serine O-phosphatidyltransferase [Vibrio cincinnatiensis]MCG3741611.1 CDP-diacylglycerol--serine O-phosphatidyltransferase [Vibrio cincinnatiensis]MCG3745213.1 CDP-diacylglycerol--serine O-phosphatidyltransferase [Vibrio cincinnatiensis]MCG3760735.1 CDP-diacylglycerol--serine O-phosphatidyltransferase [Vibrio cincinnatiensis]MCG3763982.1 CDP-diacylglycerol--serine O-phosphatidyltran
MMARKNTFEQLPAIAQDPDKFSVLFSAKEFRAHLIDSIRQASKRIYIVALYLEDDEAGREILTELYEAKQRNPGLEITICVDWHRAQRGLIGSEASAGNAALYCSLKKSYPHCIPIYGIPVRGKEIFGVLHLKGFIIDDQVIYSGASINNVYLHYKTRYRFDRYHTLENKALADSMVAFIQREMLEHPAVNDLACDNKPKTRDIKVDIRQFRAALAQASYLFEPEAVTSSQVAITPLVGIGKRRNHLNQTIVDLIAQATEEIFICTPYFNFPKSVAKEVKKALKRGVKVHIVVGDKTANDFYIPPQETFKTIGGLPYLYELNLRRFAKINEANIASRKLSIHLWKDGDNSFHLKGIWVDKRYMLITGNNLNPRAWKLDLENAILVKDKNQHLTNKFEKEIENILQHTQLICTYKQIEKLDSYPDNVQNLIRKVTRVKADRVLKQIL